jgi:hypothetical protein
MLLIKRQSTRRLALSLSFCLVLASVGPSLALACEGGGNEGSAALTPIKWSGGGECPLKEKEVHYAAEKAWCEYELLNTNKVETIKLNVGEVNRKSKECEEKECVTFTKGVEAGTTECVAKLEVAAGKGCRERVEYKTKPAKQTLIGYRWTLESVPSEKVFAMEVSQVVE